MSSSKFQITYFIIKMITLMTIIRTDASSNEVDDKDFNFISYQGKPNNCLFWKFYFSILNIHTGLIVVQDLLSEVKISFQTVKRNSHSVHKIVLIILTWAAFCNSIDEYFICLCFIIHLYNCRSLHLSVMRQEIALDFGAKFKKELHLIIYKEVIVCTMYIVHALIAD